MYFLMGILAAFVAFVLGLFGIMSPAAPAPTAPLQVSAPSAYQAPQHTNAPSPAAPSAPVAVSTSAATPAAPQPVAVAPDAPGFLMPSSIPHPDVFTICTGSLATGTYEISCRDKAFDESLMFTESSETPQAQQTALEQIASYETNFENVTYDGDPVHVFVYYTDANNPQHGGSINLYASDGADRSVVLTYSHNPGTTAVFSVDDIVNLFESMTRQTQLPAGVK